MIWILNYNKKQKIILRKIFFKLIVNTVFGKTVEEVRKYRDIKLVPTESRRNYLVPKPSYHNTKFFYRKFINNENEKKTQLLMNKPVYLGLLILDLSKTIMYELWYDYVKPKYG